MKIFKILFAALMLSSASITFANHPFPPSTLTMTILNHSSETISFTGFKAERAGNEVKIPTKIAQGANAIIIATSTQGNDLAGVITSNNVPTGFYLLDCNFSHIHQPVFLANEKFQVNVLTKTINPDRKNPHGLFYTDVTVEITNKN